MNIVYEDTASDKDIDSYKNQIDTKRYEKIEYLAEGNFGIVFKAFDKNNKKTVAIKVVEIQDPSFLWEKEVAMLRKYFIAKPDCPHPNVLCFYDIMINEYYAVFVTELLLGYTFQEILMRKISIVPAILQNVKFSHKHLPPTNMDIVHQEVIEFLTATKQILEGLVWMHSKQIAHRDIHPGNLFISKNKQIVTILDFGLSCVANDDNETVCILH